MHVKGKNNDVSRTKIYIYRVRHKHSPTRHGEWKFHLASTTWKSLAKMASMKFGQNNFGEYEIKVTRQILISTYILITFKHVSNIVHIFKYRWKFRSRLRRSQYKNKYGDVISASILHDLKTLTNWFNIQECTAYLNQTSSSSSNDRKWLNVYNFWQSQSLIIS